MNILSNAQSIERLNRTFDVARVLLPNRISPKMVQTKAARTDPIEPVPSPRHRSGDRFLLGFLLLTTCVLFLHLQSAKNRCEFLPNTTHVVHGDLEVESERPAHVFAQVFDWSPVAACAVLASSPIPSLVHTFQAFPPACDLTKISLMRHLARLFRAPPAL